MLIKMYGKDDGLFFDGKKDDFLSLPLSMMMMTMIWFSSRPYLHMYAHSNEVEELGVISLFGVNVESDPLKESLLGVSVVLFFSFLVK